MKWVLLLGVFVSLVNGRTIFDYERDGLDNKQEGLPGRSVTGQYEWRGPDGRVTEVSYIADHLGFRLLDDLELKPPTEPFRPSESTAQISMKSASDSSYSEQEEEEEEEEEEENETEEGENEEEEEEEEQEQEEEGGEETSAAKEQERTADKETEQEEAEASAAETENVENSKTNEKEADATEEDGSKTSESNGKSLDQSDATEKQETSVDSIKEDINNTPVIEARTGANDVPRLVPVKVDSTSPEEESNVIEATVIDESPATDENEPALVEETPVIATAEMTLTAEPMVAPIAKDLSAFASKDLGPSAEIPISNAEVLPASLADNQEMALTSDSAGHPSVFPGPAIVVIGSFSDEGYDVQNDFEREERTVVNMNEAQEQIPESFIDTAVFPVAEPLQQSVAEIKSVPINVALPSVAEPSQRVGEIEQISIDVEVSPVAEPLQQPAGEVELVLADKPIPALVSEASEPQLFLEVPVQSAFESAAPVAKMLDIEHQATQTVPVFEHDVAQQIDRLIQDSTMQEIPLALPIQQVQMPETDSVRPVERAFNQDESATIFVKEIKSTEVDNRPTLEFELDKHRFDLNQPSHSINTIPVLADNAEESSMRNLYFISETLQVPDLQPGLPTVQFIEVPTQEKMMGESKMVFQPEEPLNSEFIRKSTNELDKPAILQSSPFPNAMNAVPIESLQSEVAFMPSQEMLVQVPEMEDTFPVTVKALVSVPQIQETMPIQTPEQMDFSSTGESNVVELQSPQTENIVVPVEIVEIPVDVETVDPESVIFIRSNEPPKINKAPMQGPPLLPPLMKVPRLLI